MDNTPDLIKANISYDDYARYMPPLASFYQNYIDMQNQNELYKQKNQKYIGGTDKYFHAKANCQSGQNAFIKALLGLDNDNAYDTISEILLLDFGKEGKDLIEKNHINKINNYSTNHKDSREDIYADHTGLLQGLFHPFSDCSTLLKNINMRPDGIDNKY